MIRLALLLAPLALAGAGPVLRVDGIELTSEAISRRAAALRAEGRTFAAAHLVEALIDEAALASDARKQGLDREPAVRAAVEQATMRALADGFTNSRLAGTVTLGEAELKEMYHQGADTVRLLMVAVATEAEARQVRARIEAGGEFALEAARSLDSRSASRKGDTGELTRVQLAPELAKQAFAAPVGTLLGPVPLSAGFAVARITERKIGDDAGFAARRAALERFARQQALTGARKHFSEMSRKKYQASVDTAFIESLGRRTDMTPAEAETPFAKVGTQSFPYRMLHPRTLAAGSGHLVGPGARVQLAWAFVDERVLALAAREAGYTPDAGVKLDIAAAEIQALATAMAERIGAKLPATASARARDEAVRKRIADLRDDLTVKLDRKAALAAAEMPR